MPVILQKGGSEGEGGLLVKGREVVEGGIRVVETYESTSHTAILQSLRQPSIIFQVISIE